MKDCRTETRIRPPSVTRRKFLEGAAAGLGVTLGGARVLAEPPTSADLDERGLGVERNFVYGTHFYHPESGPRPDQFRSMIDAIANKYHFNIIRIFPPWDYYNPRPGEYHFDDLEQLLNICDEFDVRVLMGIMIESSPYWLEQAYPRTRHVNAQGQPFRLQGNGGHYTGGSPGLCLDWEVIREAAALFIHALVKLSASHRSLYAYDVWNEPNLIDWGYGELTRTPALATVGWPLFCYCDATVFEFQKWLRRRYSGSLDRLNKAWIRRFPDWRAIYPPTIPWQMYTDWMDWRKFLQDRTAEFISFRVTAVRDIDTKHIIECHVADFPPVTSATRRGTQNWKLAKAVEIFGLSYYPPADAPLCQSAALVDVTRSNAAGKEFWMTELAGNFFNRGYRRSPPMRPRKMRTSNWLAVAAGAKGIVYWTYLTEGTGHEAGGFGLVRRNGEPTERVLEAAKTNRLIQARWDLLKNYQPEPEIAILFDQDNALLTFAMNATEEPSTQSASGYYRAFWNLDFLVDFIEPAGIDSSRYKVLIVPWHLIGKKATCDSLQRFAEQGGTVVLESGFARFNDNYHYNPVIPGHGLDVVFGYRERESIMIESGKAPLEALNQAPSGANPYEAEIEFSQPARVKVKANTYLTPVQISLATPIATWRRRAVATMKNVGRGRVYFVGTNLGGSIAAGDAGGIELLRAMVSPVVRSQASSSGKVRPRLIEAPDRGLLIIFNDTAEDQTASITVPVTYHRATDIYTGKQHAIGDRKLELTVPFRDVAVLDLD
jgi:beta-galactosidase GanA